MQSLPSDDEVRGIEVADRFVASASHLPTCSITVTIRPNSTSTTSTWVLLQHPCPDVAAGTRTSPTLTRGFRSARATLLHRLRANFAFNNFYNFCIGPSPNCVHCNSSEKLDPLLMHCPRTPRTLYTVFLVYLALTGRGNFFEDKYVESL